MDEKVLYTLNYGVYLISTKFQDKINGQIANVVFQVTSEPPKIAICLNKKNLTHLMILNSGIFNVSILGRSCNMKFIGKFGFKSGRDINKFEDVNYIIGKNGAPIVKDFSVAYLECEVEKMLDVGTHSLFIGKVTEGNFLNEDTPLTYSYYHSELKGKEPENAPTFVKKRKE